MTWPRFLTQYKDELTLFREASAIFKLLVVVNSNGLGALKREGLGVFGGRNCETVGTAGVDEPVVLVGGAEEEEFGPRDVEEEGNLKAKGGKVILLRCDLQKYPWCFMQ